MKNILIIIAVVLLVAAGILVALYEVDRERAGNEPASYTSITSEEVNFYNQNDPFSCGRYLNGESPAAKNLVINSDQEYTKLQSETESYFRCSWSTPAPKIDFSQKTLLGQYTMGGGCTIDFKKSALKDEKHKKILYLVEVQNNGGCAMAGYSMNWITIPKLPKGFTVEFKTTQE